MAALTMDRSRPPLLFPTLLVPVHNHSDSEPAMPPPSPGPLGLNEDPGWPGNRTTGPRYARTPGEVAAASVFFGTLWLSSVIGNSLVCLVIHRSRRAQSTTNYFVVSLACADLLASVAGAPFVLLQFALGRWALGGAACRLVRFAQYLTPGVQSSVLLCISIDRFYTVVYPLSFKVSREKAKRMIAASWLLDAALASPVLFLFGPAGDGQCPHFPPASWQGTAFAALQVLAGFAVPSSLLVLVYRRVVRHIWRLGGDGRAVRRTMNVVPRTKVRTVQVFLLLSLLFLLSWLPFHVAQLWHPGERDARQSALVFTAVACVAFSSSASKPALYAISNANFRRGVKETFCMSATKCYRSNAYTITTSSRMAKRNYVGISEIPPLAKAGTKDSIYDAFDREAKGKKLAWPINSNPPNTFV
ncbi:probable G-protein coupled receptor 19 isoform X2 [Perognathus longimembris pacificus]|nr:probable G-protein coupled receptor 19 isoform X2 [Perognathus longimembris pacificus]